MFKKPKLPQVRHTWKIKPQSRIKTSAKIYRRTKGKKKSWVDDIGWFGEL